MHNTDLECREHEAECPWGREGLNEPELRACPTCGNHNVRACGHRCAAKGGMITEPVFMCRWWRAQAGTRPAPPLPSEDVTPINSNVFMAGL
jgi:hypothetical protein